MKILITFLLALVTFSSSAESVVVTDTQTKDDIDTATLKMIFKGVHTRWENGTPITVIVLPKDSSSTREFIFQFIGSTPSSFFDIITSKISRGNGRFVLVKDEKEVIKKIESKEGSIGYVNNIFIINDSGSIRIVSVQ